MRYLRKKRKLKGKPVILYDDREKFPWLFLANKYTMEKTRLKVGDYTVKGFENLIAIEKKSGIDELFSNLVCGQRRRFERFLKRLSEYPVKAIVVEQPFIHAIVCKTAYVLRRKSRTQMSVDTIYYWTAEIMEKYNIPIIYVDKNAVEPLVFDLIKRAIDKAERI